MNGKLGKDKVRFGNMSGENACGENTFGRKQMSWNMKLCWKTILS
jgi:hypothetical protein